MIRVERNRRSGTSWVRRRLGFWVRPAAERGPAAGLRGWPRNESALRLCATSWHSSCYKGGESQRGRDVGALGVRFDVARALLRLLESPRADDNEA